MTQHAPLQEPSVPLRPVAGAFVDLSGKDFRFWTALVWRFRHSNPAQPVISFIWDFALADESRSTDPQHEVLLESFKTVVWGMLKNDAYGKPLSIGSLPRLGSGIREAFRWFVNMGIEDFSQLNLKVLQDYLTALPKLIVDKEEVYPNIVFEGYSFGYHSDSLRPGSLEVSTVDEALDDDLLPEQAANDPEVSATPARAKAKAKAKASVDASDSPPNVEGEPGEDEDDGASYSQVANRISVFYYIHAQRERLVKRNLPAMKERPFKGRSPSEVATGITPHVINRIPALPQSVSVPLLNEVLRWVDDVGPKVKSVHDAFHLTRKDGGAALESVFAELDAAGFSTERFAKLPWRERLEGRDESLEDSLDFGNHRMRLANLMCRDACTLALQYLAGLRISEVCSVTVTLEKVDGLPSCVYKRPSPDGMMDLYFLKAKLVKGQPYPVDKDWVIGCVPAGSNQVPVLVRALNQLHDIAAPYLVKGKESPLFFHYANRWGMPQTRASVVQATGTDLQRGCRRFIRCFVDFSKLPDFDDYGTDLRRYRLSRGTCIRTHQGRKTFADYCLKTRKSSLSALSFHYGHLTESITYKGYFPPVQRLNDEVESMSLSATVDTMVGWSEGKVVLGNMAKAVDDFLAENGLDSIKDVVKLRQKVKELVLAQDLRIFFNAAGNCFISVAPLKSRCQQAAGGTSWMLRTPNYTTRTVSMCAGCDCFGLDASHLPYWENRERQWRDAANDPTNRVAVSRHAQSVAVIHLFRKKAKK